jgi:hypothetical protein
MLNVKHEGEYDAERNIVFLKYINAPLTFEDADYLCKENERWYKKGGENKVWVIPDVSEMGMPSVKLVKYFHEKEKPLNDKHIIDYCVICTKPLLKISALLFNTLMRRKSMIFKTRQEAVDWVLKEQETRGRFAPL